MKIKDILKKIGIFKIAILTALLGAYGGQGKKEYRRIYIPLIIILLALCSLRNWWVLTIMFMGVAFSTGYGIPDDTDDGSALGKFWYKIVERIMIFFCNFISLTKSELFANILTRGTIALMVNLSLISIPILKGNWITYYIGCLFIKLAYTTCSWRDLGVIRIKDKHLLISDVVTYGTIGLMASIMIYY